MFALSQVPWESPGPALAWRSDLDTALEEARRDSRPVAISFHADWCSICNRLDRETLRSAPVAKELERFVIIRVDTTKPSPEAHAAFRRFGINGVPTVVFIDASGRDLGWSRTRGFVQPQRFLEILRSIG
ncbi:MAG: thioredoxin family protein [Planctomycetes bacterium]|nr:thioredoxin family protein [Planctomycetota bacterium]